jgi:hypothetical protein
MVLSSHFVESVSGLTFSSSSLFVDLGLSVSVTLVSEFEKVLITVLLDHKQTMLNKTATYSVFRDSVNLHPNGIQIIEAQEVAEKRPCSFTFFDEPGAAGTLVYSVRAKGDATINSRTRQLAAIVVPNSYASSAMAITTPLVLSSTHFMFLGLELSIATTSAFDFVLLTLTLNIKAISNGYADITIYRDGSSILTGSAVMQKVSYFASNSFRSKHAVSVPFLDRPGRIGDVAYSVWGRYSGGSCLIGVDNQTRQFTAIVVPASQGSISLPVTQSTVFTTPPTMTKLTCKLALCLQKSLVVFLLLLMLITNF